MPETQELTLKELLGQHTKEGELYRNLGNGTLECFACGHRCVVKEGRDGICRVRFNRGGKLYVPWGYVGALQLDPIEKKPFFHALPGNLAMSFGMMGCDYHCSYCQNWVTSQALRDPNAVAAPEFMSPTDFAVLALKHGAKVVTSTYNEPLITSEWAIEIFKTARQYGLVTSYVSNGNGTPEVLEYIRPWVDLYKVDLKGYDDKHYRTLGGVLQHVLDTIKMLYEKKFWLEVVTLFVPGFNDSEGEMRDIASFLVSVSPDIPWHVTAFHSDYKMMDTQSTPVKTLIRAAEIGYEAGLRYVYAGNLPGSVGQYENTYCPACNGTLIERRGFRVLRNALKNGRCPKCTTVIPGFWNAPSKP
ncbi:MAG: AmmeMemoRadiSam system radical SAM enzyme [Ignavibacteriae bacterium]|nr:AmmeMemoRadiSam system radical SAM enzyme [Ignavibacteria bacterium]MBI3363272.1 AmmeMemoRadiSam system radical SAM enzyme [Ignavibacteriota bacterium]